MPDALAALIVAVIAGGFIAAIATGRIRLPEEHDHR